MFLNEFDVSRETLDRLKIYESLLIKWNQSINLVSRGTLDNIWHRHFLDSAQLIPFLPKNPMTLIDLGSGAGFPGLVLAAMTEWIIILIESDRRKVAFLHEAVRHMMLKNVKIYPARIDEITDLKSDVVTARALCHLSKLLEYSERFLSKEGICLYLKGSGFNNELTESNKVWHIDLEVKNSITHSAGYVVKIKSFSRKKLAD